MSIRAIEKNGVLYYSGEDLAAELEEIRQEENTPDESRVTIAGIVLGLRARLIMDEMMIKHI
jgi:hypothetical protein